MMMSPASIAKKLARVTWHSVPVGMRAFLFRARRRREFRHEFERFSDLSLAVSLVPPAWDDHYMLLEDATATTDFDPHYIYHPAWAARLLAEFRPAEHVDISSSLHFCTLVSAWLPVRFYDYRPAPLVLDGLRSEFADLMALPFADDSVASLSCMHVIEHIGLGRYGDPLDAQGDLKAMRELARVLQPGGRLLFVTPVGAPRVRFNSHRIYSVEQIQQGFAGLRLREWALLPDDWSGGLLFNPNPALVARQSYGCGCFCFEK